MGFETSVDRIITSSLLTASYMKHKHPSITKVLTFCPTHLKEALQSFGIECLSTHADCENYDAMMYKLQVDSSIGAVIIGHDSAWSYNNSAVACIYVQAGAKFIATDSQRTLLLKGGRRIPSTGSLTESV
jgi:ribonucleotide monophosphatase NagD (HAD superfamily)